MGASKCFAEGEFDVFNATIVLNHEFWVRFQDHRKG